MTVQVGDHATAGIVSGRHDRQWLCRYVEAVLGAAFRDIRKMRTDKVCRFMANVEVDTIVTATLHLVVDRAGHDIPGCQFGSGIMVRHEALTTR